MLCLKISFYAFVLPLFLLDMEKLAILFFIPIVAIYLLSMAGGLRYFQKRRTKGIRVGGQVFTYLVFGGLYLLSCLMLAAYVAAAIAAASMYQ